MTSVAASLVLASTFAPTWSDSASAAYSSTDVTFRAVLCFAPNLMRKSAFPAAAALPVCRPKFRLTAENLAVTPSNSASGFTSKTVKKDPRFLDFRNTASAKILLNSDVLLPGIKGYSSTERFVLGPAVLTSLSIKSAKAEKQHLGQWVVVYRFTPSGSAAWNKFAKKQFHAYIAVVANGEVYSAPLIQPTLTKFASFGASGEISGSFTKTEAIDLAKWL
jgi:preprotein translocase subunit SecD